MVYKKLAKLIIKNGGIKMFSGSYVALVTPFKNGQVDKEKLEELVEWHITQGTNGIVPCGTTGESATLSHQEHDDVVETVVKAAGGRVKVIAGTGSNNTIEALRMTRFAKEIGADGALIITPYYNKPTQDGLYLHFKKIADEVDIPIILYNVPGRTAVNLLPATVVKLAKDCKNIVGVKEASGLLGQVTKIIKGCGEDFIVLSGDDSLTFPMLALGGKGVISVVANIMPKDMAEMVGSFLSGNMVKAKELHYKMFLLMEAMFYETNPAPVKAVMDLMGKCSAFVRLPLSPMRDENLEKLKSIMKECKLL